MTTRTFKSMTLAGLMSLAACNAVVPAQLPVLPPADSPSRVAAAVTGGIVECEMLPMAPPPAIRFDRPFIWAIGDLTTAASPYFMGLFEQPN